MLLREMAFRAICRHRQGEKPNILLYCTRRGGSTWLLNALSAHPGMRYVGRPLLSVLDSRWHRRMPDLAAAAGHTGRHRFRQVIGFEPHQEDDFLALSRDIFSGDLPLYPSLNVRAPYFHRQTDRVVFQMTSGQSMIEWFDRNLEVATVVLYRHPIPTALSVLREGWTDDCADFLLHERFRETYLEPDQVALAERIMQSGSTMERHVLDWTLHMLVPSRRLQEGGGNNWLVLTYEDAVNEPDEVVRRLSCHLGLSDTVAMQTQLTQPSRTVTSSTAVHRADSSYLLDRWRHQVGPDQARRLLDIPRTFGIARYTD